MFVSVCGNLQSFIVLALSAVMQNAANISYANFRVTSVFTKTLLASSLVHTMYRSKTV